MKICFISNLYPPETLGGAELYLEKIVKKISEDKKNQIIIITANQKFSFKTLIEEKGNIKIYRLWPFNLYSLTTKRKYNFIFKLIWHLIDLWNPFVYFTIKKILKKEKPEIVHTHNFTSLSFSIFSAIKSLKIPLIYTCHDYYLLCPYTNLVCPLTGWRFKKTPPFFCQWYRRITRKILKNKIDVALFPSKFVMNLHLKNGFFISSHRILLPFGITPLFFSLSDISLTFLCVSQLAPHKGVGVLIKAYKLLKEPKPKLLIVGEGLERKKLEKMANDDKNIIFLGRLSYSELEKKYQEAGVVIIPSLAPETFSFVMFEAMASGKLVIASRIGALAEYIKDSENGLLFEPGNINQLKEILEKILLNPDLIKKISENAFQFAQEFTFEKHCQKLIKIYRKII